MSEKNDGSSKVPVAAETKAWWQEWLSPGVILAALGAVAMLGYMVFYRIPDLEKQVAKVSDEEASRFQEVQRQNKETFDRLQVQLVNVRTNLLRLCMRAAPKNQDCEIKDLVATVGEMSSLQSQYLASAEIKQLKGDSPAASSSVIKDQLKALMEFPQSASITETAKIANVVAWSAIARDAVWSIDGKKLKVDFSNGSAEFTPKGNVAKSTLDDFVMSLNSIAGVVQGTIPDTKVAK